MKPKILRDEYPSIRKAFESLGEVRGQVWKALESKSSDDPRLFVYFQAEFLRVNDFCKAIQMLSDDLRSEPASVLCRSLLEVVWHMNFILTSQNPTAVCLSLNVKSIKELLKQHDSKSFKSGVGKPLSDDPEELRSLLGELKSELRDIEEPGSDQDIGSISVERICQILDERMSANAGEKTTRTQQEYDRHYRNWSQPTHGLILGVRNYFKKDGSFYDPRSEEAISRSLFTALATLEFSLRFMGLGNDYFKLGQEELIRSEFQNYSVLLGEFEQRFNWS